MKYRCISRETTQKTFREISQFCNRFSYIDCNYQRIRHGETFKGLWLRSLASRLPISSLQIVPDNDDRGVNIRLNGPTTDEQFFVPYYNVANGANGSFTYFIGLLVITWFGFANDNYHGYCVRKESMNSALYRIILKMYQRREQLNDHFNN